MITTVGTKQNDDHDYLIEIVVEAWAFSELYGAKSKAQALFWKRIRTLLLDSVCY